MARIHGFPAAPVPLLSEGRWNHHEFSFRLQGTSGGRYAIQTSTNLADWQGWTSVQLTGASAVLTHAVPATNTVPHFYRAVAE